MLKVALSGLRTNKVRLALTSIAIIIGVAFVAALPRLQEAVAPLLAVAGG